MVPPSSDRIPRVPPYSRTHEDLPVRGCHPLRHGFPAASGSPSRATGLVRFRSPLLTESRLMSFPPGTEMFQFPGFASMNLAAHRWSPDDRGQKTEDRKTAQAFCPPSSDTCHPITGLPHSEIPGSKPAHGSPGLIAACHVLHRLCMPRHPPNALQALDPKPSGQRPSGRQ